MKSCFWKVSTLVGIRSTATSWGAGGQADLFPLKSGCVLALLPWPQQLDTGRAQRSCTAAGRHVEGDMSHSSSTGRGCLAPWHWWGEEFMIMS